jgi:hypothetical protein
MSIELEFFFAGVLREVDARASHYLFQLIGAGSVCNYRKTWRGERKIVGCAELAFLFLIRPARDSRLLWLARNICFLRQRLMSGWKYEGNKIVQYRAAVIVI